MNICVFCGSSTGNDPVFKNEAAELGRLFAKNSHTLVYGGGNVGLMGVIADAVLEHGGKVTGVIPDFLVKREVCHRGITNLEIVNSMHERKKRMADLSDAFIAIPGGWGTLDELAEILTWRQLGLINQPIGLLNTKGFFTPLLDQMTRMAENGFLRHENLEFLIVRETAPEMLTAIIPYKG